MFRLNITVLGKFTTLSDVFHSQVSGLAVCCYWRGTRTNKEYHSWGPQVFFSRGFNSGFFQGWLKGYFPGGAAVAKFHFSNMETNRKTFFN